MPVGAIVTLCAFGVGVIALGIVLLVMGGKPKFFKGKRFTGSFNGLKTTFIVGSKTGMSVSKELGGGMAHYCSLVNDTVRAAFRDIATSKALKKTKYVIVQLMDNETYVNQGGKRYRDYYEHSVVCITKTSCWFWGDEIPTMCIRLRTVPPLSKVFSPQGEPLVHELCHAYLDDYAADKDDHADPRVWIEAGGQDSAQYRARVAVSAYNRTSRA